MCVLPRRNSSFMYGLGSDTCRSSSGRSPAPHCHVSPRGACGGQVALRHVVLSVFLFPLSVSFRQSCNSSSFTSCSYQKDEREPPNKVLSGMRFGKESHFTSCLVFWLLTQPNYFDVQTIFLNSFDEEPFLLGHGPVPKLLGFQSIAFWQFCQLQLSTDAAAPCYLSHTAVTFCCMPPACRNLISSLSPKHSRPNAGKISLQCCPPDTNSFPPLCTANQQSTYQHAACFTSGS
jgi:hypothetical protein